jgi:excisionase family DNA binding protein
MPELLSLKEAADTLGLDPHTIRRWIKTEKLPGYKVVGQWRIKREYLDALLVPPPPTAPKPPTALV